MGHPNQTKLGKLQATKTAEPEPEKVSKLGGFLARGSRGKRKRIPLLGDVWIELASHDRLNEIEGETFREMERLSVPLAQITALTWEADKVARVLAWSVRDLDDPSHVTPFGTLEQWANLDSDIIAAANLVYMNTRAELDPLGVADGEWSKLSDEQRAGIMFAVEKKSLPLLLSYGSITLANFILTSEFQRATSQTPTSLSGVSSPENSESSSQPTTPEESPQE